MKSLPRIQTVRLLIAISFPWIVLFVSPLTVEFGNRHGYSGVWVLVYPLLFASALGSAIVYSILTIISKYARIYKLTSGIILGAAIAAWVQSQLFLWDRRLLVGGAVDWDGFQVHSIIELVAWTLSIMAITVFVLKSTRVGLLKTLSVAIILLGLGSLAVSLPVPSSKDPIPVPSSKDPITLTDRSYKEISDAFSFHERNNVIVIILDAFQSDIFQEIIDKHPNEISFLNGFKYYPDTTSSNLGTKFSIPSLGAGKIYKNDFIYSSSNASKFTEKWIGEYFREIGYGIQCKFLVAVLSNKKKDHFNPSFYNTPKFGGLLSDRQILTIDRGLYRSSPIIVKPYILDKGRWLLTKMMNEGMAMEHYRDQAFVDSFIHNANVSSKNTGEFKFIHLWATHPPIELDENFKPHNITISHENTREMFTKQARGTLKLMKGMIDKLNKLGVYTSSEILILADHGLGLAPNDSYGDPGSAEVPLGHIALGRPLFLYKERGAGGPLEISLAPMYLPYVPCLLASTSEFDCTDFKAMKRGETPPRELYFSAMVSRPANQEFERPITLYKVIGDSRKYDSWKNTFHVFEGGNSNYLKNRYHLGEQIDFGNGGRADDFLLPGWKLSHTHRWATDRVGMKLHISDLSMEDIMVLRIDGVRLVSPETMVRSVTVTIEANGITVGRWELGNRETYEALIPRNIVVDNELILYFNINVGGLMSTYIEGYSDDPGRLGIGIFGMSLE